MLTTFSSPWFVEHRISICTVDAHPLMLSTCVYTHLANNILLTKNAYEIPNKMHIHILPHSCAFHGFTSVWSQSDELSPSEHDRLRRYQWYPINLVPISAYNGVARLRHRLPHLKRPTELHHYYSSLALCMHLTWLISVGTSQHFSFIVACCSLLSPNCNHHQSNTVNVVHCADDNEPSASIIDIHWPSSSIMSLLFVGCYLCLLSTFDHT